MAAITGGPWLFGNELNFFSDRQFNLQSGVDADFSSVLIAFANMITGSTLGAIWRFAVATHIGWFYDITVFRRRNRVTEKHLADFETAADGAFVFRVVGQKAYARQ